MASTEPTPTETARATKGMVTKLSATFMMDPPTYIAAAEVGYEGLAFYYAGRGGVLGDVDAAEVAEAFHFFPEASVRAGWEQAASVEAPAASARRFAEAAARWAESRLDAAALEFDRLAELLGIVETAAPATDEQAAYGLFTGWRALPEPDDPRALVVHRANALRELRFARHVAAVRQVGLDPLVALMVSAPHMADVFGWPPPRPEPTESDRAAWEEAEAATDEAFGRDLGALDGPQRAALVVLAKAASAAAR